MTTMNRATPEGPTPSGVPPAQSGDALLLPKARTGIRGLDEVTDGGLPRGRPTLIAGAAGTGKTLLGLEFLVRGALEFGEPGVLIAFEETAADLVANVASLGFDLGRMQADGQLVIDSVRIDAAEIVEAGTYDLEGLFLRLGLAVEQVGAKRVVLDTIEVLFSALPNEAIVRGELTRLFRWLKDRGLTTIVTGEPGREQLTRHGTEEYVSDCVILLNHRVTEEISTRRLRILKYRGSTHGTNEYPFLINDQGIVVLPVTSLALDPGAPTERISTGVSRLDHMLGGGVYRGTTVLVSGTSGAGKTTLAAQMAAAACARGEHALFVSFEESPAKLVRNMASVGIDLQRWVDAGLLTVWATPPTAYGLESHLASLAALIEEQVPRVVVLDAVTGLLHVGVSAQVTMAVIREIAALKARGITAVLTTLIGAGGGAATGLVVSSLVDTWLLVRNVETNGEYNRLLFVRKSRGSAHSNQVREFVLTDQGVELLDVYVGPEGVLTGKARIAREAADRATARDRAQAVSRSRRKLREHAAQVEAQVTQLRGQLADETAKVEQMKAELAREDAALAGDRVEMAQHGWADSAPAPTAPTEGEG